MLKREWMEKGKRYMAFLLAGVLILGGFGGAELVLAVGNETEPLAALMDGTTEIGATDTSVEVEENEKEMVISGTIVPSLVEEEQDVSRIEMHKIVFPENAQVAGTASGADASLTVIEQVYTCNVRGRGGLYLALASADTVSFQSLKLQVYSDRLLTEKIGKDYTLKPDTKVIDTKDYYLKSGGTYYLKFTYRGNGEEQDKAEKAFLMTAAFMYSTDRTLPEGKNLVTYADSGKRTVYYKVNAKKAGLLSFTAIPENGKDLLTGHITLCDKNKQPISVTEYVSGSADSNLAVHTYYGVRKGTYYIKAKLNASYVSSFSVEEAKKQAGSGMGTAEKLVLGGKAKKAILYLSDSIETEKWYRFRLKKNQNFSIILNSCVNGYLNVEVCNSAGITVKSGETKFYTGTKILKTSSKWQRGTYYIKITKGKKSVKSSGYFSIRVK